MGNAWCIPVPRGTIIKTENPELNAIAYKEIQNGVTIEEIYIVNKQYLWEQTEQQLNQLEVIEKLKIKAGVP